VRTEHWNFKIDVCKIIYHGTSQLHSSHGSELHCSTLPCISFRYREAWCYWNRSALYSNSIQLCHHRVTITLNHDAAPIQLIGESYQPKPTFLQQVRFLYAEVYWCNQGAGLHDVTGRSNSGGETSFAFGSQLAVAIWWTVSIYLKEPHHPAIGWMVAALNGGHRNNKHDASKSARYIRSLRCK